MLRGVCAPCARGAARGAPRAAGCGAAASNVAASKALPPRLCSDATLSARAGARGCAEAAPFCAARSWLICFANVVRSARSAVTVSSRLAALVRATPSSAACASRSDCSASRRATASFAPSACASSAALVCAARSVSLSAASAASSATASPARRTTHEMAMPGQEPARAVARAGVASSEPVRTVFGAGLGGGGLGGGGAGGERLGLLRHFLLLRRVRAAQRLELLLEAVACTHARPVTARRMGMQRRRGPRGRGTHPSGSTR